jgi:hypothetical protein
MALDGQIWQSPNAEINPEREYLYPSLILQETTV